MAWLGFASRVNSYATEQEDHPSHWGTTHSSVFLQCLGAILPLLDGCLSAYRLGVKVNLNLACHVGPNRF